MYKSKIFSISFFIPIFFHFSGQASMYLHSLSRFIFSKSKLSEVEEYELSQRFDVSNLLPKLFQNPEVSNSRMEFFFDLIVTSLQKPGLVHLSTTLMTKIIETNFPINFFKLLEVILPLCTENKISSGSLERLTSIEIPPLDSNNSLKLLQVLSSFLPNKESYSVIIILLATKSLSSNILPFLIFIKVIFKKRFSILHSTIAS